MHSSVPLDLLRIAVGLAMTGWGVLVLQSKLSGGRPSARAGGRRPVRGAVLVAAGVVVAVGGLIAIVDGTHP